MNTLTTAFPAKQKLVEIFNTNLEDVTAYFGKPNYKTPDEENIYVLNIEKGHREWRNLASAPRRPRQVVEEYQIRVLVEVRRRNGAAEETEQRAWELTQLLEEALAENTSLDGLVISALATDFEAPSEGGPDGWACTSSFAVAIEARV